MTPLPPVKVTHPHVEVRDDILDGSPIVKGSRLPVRRLWFWHRRGVTIASLVKRYPRFGWSAILDALAFCYDNEELVEADALRETQVIAAEMLQLKLPLKVQ